MTCTTTKYLLPFITTYAIIRGFDRDAKVRPDAEMSVGDLRFFVELDLAAPTTNAKNTAGNEPKLTSIIAALIFYWSFRRVRCVAEI